MTKLTLSNASALAGINNNFKLIQDELNNKVFYRVNPIGEPNSLNNTNIDLNNNNLFNANEVRATSMFIDGVEVEPTSVALAESLKKQNNLSDLANVVTARGNLGLGNVDNTSDANKPVSTATQTALNLKANLAGGAEFTGAITIGGDVVTTNTATQTLTNKTLTAPVISTIVNTGTLTLPTSTDTLVGRATTDTLTNKTYSSGVVTGTFTGTPTYSGLITFSGGISPSQTIGIIGTTTNNNANAGSVGEYVTANATGVAATSGVNLNVTSISLTAGDWEIDGLIATFPAGGTTTSFVIGGISVGSAVFSTINAGPPQFDNVALHSSAIPAGAQFQEVVPNTRLTLAATTTVFLVMSVTFATSTMQVGGSIRARRVR